MLTKSEKKNHWNVLYQRCRLHALDFCAAFCLCVLQGVSNNLGEKSRTPPKVCITKQRLQHVSGGKEMRKEILKQPHLHWMVRLGWT